MRQLYINPIDIYIMSTNITSNPEMEGSDFQTLEYFANINNDNDMINYIADFIYPSLFKQPLDEGNLRNDIIDTLQHILNVLIDIRKTNTMKSILDKLDIMKNNNKKGSSNDRNKLRLLIECCTVCIYYCLVRQNRLQLNDRFFEINEFNLLISKFENESIFGIYPFETNVDDKLEQLKLTYVANLGSILFVLKNDMGLRSYLDITSCIIDKKYNKYCTGSGQTIETCWRRAIYQNIFDKRPERRFYQIKRKSTDSNSDSINESESISSNNDNTENIIIKKPKQKYTPKVKLPNKPKTSKRKYTNTSKKKYTKRQTKSNILMSNNNISENNDISENDIFLSNDDIQEFDIEGLGIKKCDIKSFNIDEFYFEGLDLFEFNPELLL